MEWEIECTNCGLLDKTDLKPEVGDYNECPHCNDEYRIGSMSQVNLKE